MEKNKSNWWIDLALLGLFWISFDPDLTGIALHEWIGVAAVALAAVHLIVHWDWVAAVTLRFFSRAPGQARIYYLADLGVMTGFIMILVTGLLISTWLDLPLYDFAAWTHIHLMVSVFTLGMVVLKLILHWRWISCAVRRYAFEPVFGRPAGRASPAAAVSRRDFLKISGVLGVASAVTVHGLFDHPSEAQAQSAPPDAPAAETVPSSSAATSSPLPADAESASAAPAATQTAPVPTGTPAAACIVRCPNGCSYPGRCRKYVDWNGNNLCDNGECL